MHSNTQAPQAPQSPGGIPRATFSTDALRQVGHMDQNTIHSAWFEAMSVFFNPGTITNPELKKKYNPSGTVDGYIDNFLFDDFMTIHVCASGQTFTRSKQAIADDGMDGILVQCLNEGEIHCEAGNRSSNSVAGGIHIVDMAREGIAYTSRFDSHSVLLRRKTLEDIGLDLDQLHLRALSKKNPVAHIFNRHVREIHQKADSMTMAEAQSLEAPTAALLKAAISGSSDDRQEAASVIERGQLHEIRRFIAQNLHDPELSPNSIRQKFGLSRASLYRLAEPLGGITRFIKDCRLAHAHNILTGPTAREKSLTMLAYDLGFGSENTFRRSFKENYGISPRDALQKSN